MLTLQGSSERAELRPVGTGDITCSQACFYTRGAVSGLSGYWFSERSQGNPRDLQASNGDIPRNTETEWAHG